MTADPSAHVHLRAQMQGIVISTVKSSVAHHSWRYHCECWTKQSSRTQACCEVRPQCAVPQP
eukprot:scaffold109392_cov72-Phaeocystis_antarctica.AAC.5